MGGRKRSLRVCDQASSLPCPSIRVDRTGEGRKELVPSVGGGEERRRRDPLSPLRSWEKEEGKGKLRDQCGLRREEGRSLFLSRCEIARTTWRKGKKSCAKRKRGRMTGKCPAISGRSTSDAQTPPLLRWTNIFPPSSDDH